MLFLLGSHSQLLSPQLSMLFTEECDKVRDLMHVHSFSYDFHLRIVHQYLLGSHMALRQGYHLTSFLEDFITQHPDIPKFGRNHIFQGEDFSREFGEILQKEQAHLNSSMSLCRSTVQGKWVEYHKGTISIFIAIYVL